MEIKVMHLSELTPADYNPRVNLEPGMPEYDKLKQSIEEFGFVDPPIFNKQTGNLVGGHQRVKVAQDIGIKEISVSVVDLPLEKEKLLNVALNKISGHWDDEKLAELLQELSNDEIKLSGFDLQEADDLLTRFNYNQEIAQPVLEDSFDVQENLNKINEPRTQLGNLWKLGNHYLMCGDATSQKDVETLMQGNKADLVVTDPPYNVAVQSDSEELEESGRGTIMNDSMSDEDFDHFLLGTFKSYDDLTKDSAAVYVFHSSSYQREFENAMNLHNIMVRSQCIWVKQGMTFGWSQYRWQHEPCFYAFKKGHSPSWYGNRKQSTVWRDELLPDELPNTIWEVKRDDVNKYYHPTQKPLSLIAIPVKNSSKKNDLVVDLFGGSGSTLMTCHELGRICYTLELDPIFCDIILMRFEQHTGIKPELVN